MTDLEEIIDDTITIRRATREDAPWLLEQLHNFNAFYGTSHSLIPPDEREARSTLHHLMDTQPFFIAIRGVLLDPVRIGFIAGHLGPHLFNHRLQVMTELFWWVDPIYRGTRAGALLLKDFLAYGRLHADWIVMTLEHKSPVNPETLLRRGFKPYESNFLYEVVR